MKATITIDLPDILADRGLTPAATINGLRLWWITPDGQHDYTDHPGEGAITVTLEA